MSKQAPGDALGPPSDVRARTYRGLGDAAWRWVLDHVESDDEGPWIPESVDPAGGPALRPPFPQGLHSGVSGLVHALTEIRLGREWTEEEMRLVDGVVSRLSAEAPGATDVSYFDGLSSAVGALVAADGRSAAPAPPIGNPDGPGVDLAIVDTALGRLLELLTRDEGCSQRRPVDGGGPAHRAGVGGMPAAGSQVLLSVD